MLRRRMTEALAVLLAGKFRHFLGHFLGQLHEGEAFGELALVTNEPRRASVVAEQDTVLLTVDRENYQVR